MKINMSDDQLSMENMEINLDEVNSALMPEFSDSAELLGESSILVDKTY